MRVPLTPVVSSPTLPGSVDVVIIGAGIIGAFTAWFLAKRGMKVALLEKGFVGGEQSSRNWGWCRQQNRDARELPMATHSLRLWEEFEATSGESTGFRRSGLLYLSNSDEELAGRDGAISPKRPAFERKCWEAKRLAPRRVLQRNSGKAGSLLRPMGPQILVTLHLPWLALF